MIIGLTGGIGSGKSTVASMFNDLGVPIYDSDKEAKILMNTSANIKNALVDLFGKNAYRDNRLNRSYLANKVFKDDSLLQALNKIVHPAVKKHFKDWSNNQEAPYIIQETALIFENNSQDNYSKIILVIAPIEERVSRVMARDNSSKDDVLNRISKQLTDNDKKSKADYIIENIDLKKTFESIVNIHDELLSEAKTV